MANGIAIDRKGRAYVVSSKVAGSHYDVFAFQVNDSGSALVYDVSMGGSGDDFGNGVAVDRSTGDAWINGQARSGFPTTTGAYQTTNAGGGDAFLVRLDATGATTFGTLLGGSSDDAGNAVAVTRDHRATVTGTSTSTNFPSANALPGSAFSSSDTVFAAQFVASGASLMYSTSLGSGGGYGVAVDQRLTFTYDANNRLLTAANGAGTYTLGYDAMSRVASVQDLWGLRLTFVYDAVGNRTRVQDSLGGVATSTYDALSRLTRLDFGGTGQTPLRVDQTYNAASQVAAINRYQDLAAAYPGALSSYTYSASGLLTHYQHFNGSNSSSIANVTLSYDSHNRLTVEQRNASLTSYTCDNSDQVTADGVNTVTYDASGNRNNGSNTATTGNRLSTDGVWNYSYDDEGNQTKKVNVSSGLTWTYGYDQTNHLTRVERRTTDGGTLELSADYKYDAWGNRVEKSVDADGAGAGAAVATRFAYDGWNPAKGDSLGTSEFDVWADLDGSSSLTTRYVRGDQVDQLFARLTSSDANRWYLVDHQGSVRNILDNGAASKDALAYDAFGNIVSETNSAERGRYTWTSREIDTETGLQHNRARYYDATTGRWISQDPMGFDAGDSNLYRYVKNSSVNFADASGLLPLTESVGWFSWGGTAINKTLVLNVAIGVVFRNGWFTNGENWTRPRMDKFVDKVQSSIESQWNGTANIFRIFPTIGKDSGGGVSPEGGMNGIRPEVKITVRNLSDIPDYDPQLIVYAYPGTGGAYYAGGKRWMELYEQTPGTSIAHEFGHYLGLNHPGLLLPDRYVEAEKAAYADQWEYQADFSSLMGTGTSMRGYYFERWVNYLNAERPKFASWTMKIDHGQLNAAPARDRYAHLVPLHYQVYMPLTDQPLLDHLIKRP